MGRYLDPDPQNRPPKGYCKKCLGELYEYDDDDYCDQCLEDMDDETL